LRESVAADRRAEMGALIAQLEAETAIKPVRRGDYNIPWEADSLFHTELEWFALGDILGTRSERRIASRRGSPHRCWCNWDALLNLSRPIGAIWTLY
jgi:hypothetical protein